MAKYVYPAIFTPEKGGGYSIAFPDVEGCFTQGKDMADGKKVYSGLRINPSEWSMVNILRGVRSLLFKGRIECVIATNRNLLKGINDG